MCRERKIVLIKASENSAKKTKAGTGLGPGAHTTPASATGEQSRAGDGHRAGRMRGAWPPPAPPVTLRKGSETGVRQGECPRAPFMAKVVPPSPPVPPLDPSGQRALRRTVFCPERFSCALPAGTSPRGRAASEAGVARRQGVPCRW